MDNFQIETAQNVSIQQNVAGIGERLLGYLIDMLILAAYWLASILPSPVLVYILILAV